MQETTKRKIVVSYQMAFSYIARPIHKRIERIRFENLSGLASLLYLSVDWLINRIFFIKLI